MKTSDEILEEVNGIFKDVLENDNLVILRSSSAEEIDEWDSLTHIQLVVGVEKHFKIRFTSSEINKFKNVGEMCDAIGYKLQK